jgi:L-iditol 2-dehydrogenase
MGELMRAALLVDANRFEIRDVPRNDPRPHDVRVRVQAVGICGTDLHIVSGEANYHRDATGRAIPLTEEPQILGHEIAGVVEDVGGDVRDLAPGDQVVLDQGRTCVSEARSPLCEYCATGHSHQCEHYREHGIAGLPGGFAEYVTLPAVNAVRLAEHRDPAAAALTEPLGCVIHSLDALVGTPARYELNAGDAARRIRSVLILGGGPAGLLFTQCLREMLGFDGTLIVSDPNPIKRVLAARYDAETFDPSATDLAAEIRERTGGRRAELVIEATGAGAVFAAIPGVLRKQGTLLLYGHGHGGTELSVLNAVQFLEPRLLSPVGASGGHERDGRPTTYVRAARAIADGTIDVAPMITHRYASLDALPSAFVDARQASSYVKGVLTLD